MSLTELIEAMRKEVTQQQVEEREILDEIAAITSTEFTEQAAETLSSKKHAYGFEMYLELLSRLKRLLLAGIPTDYALDLVQTGQQVETILNLWRYGGNE